MPDDAVAVFASNTRRLRLAREWSQEKLAHVAHLDRTYIGAVERGERNITLRSAQKISSALDVALWQMLVPNA